MGKHACNLSKQLVGAGVDVSPWHDVPLENGDGSYNFICEIPKETAAKMEVATVRLTLSCLRVESQYVSPVCTSPLPTGWDQSEGPSTVARPIPPAPSAVHCRKRTRTSSDEAVLR